jgi:uncharacterized protein RhaS with RHS repeats
MRIYNPSLGRFLSTDPVGMAFPWWTPYQFAGNMPIWAIDMDGLQPMVRRGDYFYTTTKIGNKSFKVRLNINNQQQIEIRRGFSYRSFEFTSQSSKRITLFLLKPGRADEFATYSKDYKYFSATTFNGIHAYDIVNQVLIDNPELQLMIIGNDAVKTTYVFSDNDKRPIGDDEAVNKANQDEFDLARAKRVQDEFFSANNIQAVARRNFDDKKYPTINVAEVGKDPMGVTMFFDFSALDKKYPEQEKESRRSRKGENYREGHGSVRIFE